MDKCRLSLNSTGAFFHPLGDQTPIDCRYGEDLATSDLPDKVLAVIRERTLLDWGRVKRPRAVQIQNVSNQGVQSMPTDEELAVMRQRVLYVGFGDNSNASLELPPLLPGKTQFGGSQFLWLAPGAVIWLDVPAGASATVRVQIFPGSDDGKDDTDTQP